MLQFQYEILISLFNFCLTLIQFFNVRIHQFYLILVFFLLSIYYSDFLERGGNIVDAAIATLFCNGIATAQSMGIGGGFLLNLYIHKDRKAYTLNSKELAPLAATEDMFKNPDQYNDGPLSIGVPGEVKGYWELYKRFASKNFSWKELVEPAIKVCESELKLSKHMSDFIEPRLEKDNHLR